MAILPIATNLLKLDDYVPLLVMSQYKYELFLNSCFTVPKSAPDTMFDGVVYCDSICWKWCRIESNSLSVVKFCYNTACVSEANGDFKQMLQASEESLRSAFFGR